MTFEIIETVAGPARLARSKRRTLAISVLPDGSIELVAPKRAALGSIQTKVKKRARWIRKQQQAFASMNASRLPLRYVNGATHRYIGRQYRLKVNAGSQHVTLKGGYFHVSMPKPTPKAVEEALGDWYRARAIEQFEKRLAAWESWCLRRGLPAPKLKLQAMSKRWGSAGPNGTIRLNPDLVRAPSRCIDYVVAHEVCHLKHPNHGPEFYRLLTISFPLWRQVKEALECSEI